MAADEFPHDRSWGNGGDLSALVVKTGDDYTGSFVATAFSTVKYTLNDFYSSDLTTKDGPTTQVFYALIFSDGDMEEGYTMRFHYGGRSKEGWGASWESVETFDGGCVQSAIRRPEADAGELEGVRPLVHQAERSHPDAKRAVQLHGSLLSG